MLWSLVPLAFLFFGAAVAPHHAAPGSDERPSVLFVGAGGSGFRGSPAAAHFALTYHHRPFAGTVRPLAGVLGSTAGDSFVFLGMSYDLESHNGWGVTPMLTAGHYAHGTSGMDLGGAFEFRSGLEIYRRLSPWTRLGVSLHHISNAGIFEENPGRESLFLSLGHAY